MGKKGLVWLTSRSVCNTDILSWSLFLSQERDPTFSFSFCFFSFSTPQKMPQNSSSVVSMCSSYCKDVCVEQAKSGTLEGRVRRLKLPFIVLTSSLSNYSPHIWQGKKTLKPNWTRSVTRYLQRDSWKAAACCLPGGSAACLCGPLTMRRRRSTAEHTNADEKLVVTHLGHHRRMANKPRREPAWLVTTNVWWDRHFPRCRLTVGAGLFCKHFT